MNNPHYARNIFVIPTKSIDYRIIFQALFYDYSVWYFDRCRIVDKSRKINHNRVTCNALYSIRYITVLVFKRWIFIANVSIHLEYRLSNHRADTVRWTRSNVLRRLCRSVPLVFNCRRFFVLLAFCSRVRSWKKLT
jgi:hypothetical protein